MFRISRKLLFAAAFLLPAWVQAQVLDFDSVCASPPCAAGALYAASGVTLSTGSVVAAGTNGLTGTNGGRYVSISAFPFQLTISLNRNATHVSFDLSRASTSSGVLSVQVTGLRAGTPVSNQTITLTTVNTWTRATINVPAGVDSVFIDPSGGANNTFGLDNVQIAGNCYGFQDVAPGSSFCNAAEWLANRGVTLGCVAGQYCPNDNVTRAQMALFMNRLGNALSPELFQVDTAPGSIDIDTNPIVCQTGDYTAQGYPRRVQVATTFAGLAAGPLSYQHEVYRSMDGGVTWTFTWGNINRSGTSGSQWISSTTTRVVDLNAGDRMRWSVRLARTAGASDFSDSRCFIEVLVFNRTTTSAPFDAPAQDGGFTDNR